MKKLLRRFGILVCSVSFFSTYSLSANWTDPTPDSSSAVITPSVGPNRDSGKVGIGVKGSLLGAGVETAVRVTHRTNVRAGFNGFSYSRGFNKDGVSYDGRLSFKTVEAHYDVFPFAGNFHVSPGVLAYIGNPITANAAVPGGQNFSLGGTSYLSDPAVPVRGMGKINFNRAAPLVTVGWGNLVSRKESKHFSVPVELGVAFQGSPKATLNLTGNVCNDDGTECRNVTTNSSVQSNIVSEQSKINNSMRFFKVYPIISIGFGYKF